MEELACDVLVVGAGPAGSTAARVAAETGARVVLLERKAEVGVPVQCAGYVAQAIRWLVDLRHECIAQTVTGIRTFLPSGQMEENEAPGYTLHRALLDKQLVEEAVKAGVRLLLGTRAIDHRQGCVIAQRGGRRLDIQAGVIVGADGPRSFVARSMGLSPGRLATAVQYEVVLREKMSLAEIYFDPLFRSGYAWLFPAGEVARMGAAFVGDGREGVAGLDALLHRFEDAGRVSGSPLSTTSGFVPVGGPLKPCLENMVLVGDAAGHTHPITGAGVVNAIIAGEMAGRAAAMAALGGDLDLLLEYEEEWHYVFGSAMHQASEKRAFLEQRWDSGPVKLSAVLRQCWPLFDDYHKGE